jgi:DNA-binding transcriptional MerR regulator
MDKGIGMVEAAEQTGLTPGRIRYYDQQFGAYLAIPRGPGGRRYFDQAALERLATVVRLLKKEGLSIKQARNYLDSSERKAPPAVPVAQIEDLSQGMKSIGQDLERLQSNVNDLQTVVSRLVNMVAGLIELMDSGRRG